MLSNWKAAFQDEVFGKKKRNIGVLVSLGLVILLQVIMDDLITRAVWWTVDRFPGWNTSIGFVGVLVVVWAMFLLTETYFNARRREAADMERAALSLARPLLYTGLIITAFAFVTFERYTERHRVERAELADSAFAVVEHGFAIFTEYSTPLFRPLIVALHTGTPTSGGPEDATVLADRSTVVLEVAIDNLGAPAFLGSWRMEVILSGAENRSRLECPRLPETYVLTLNFDPEPVVVGAELLNNRLRRIERNDRLDGKLVCQGNNIPEGLLLQSGVRICFVVADLRPREWEQCQPLRETD